jgi:hypothetical protein
MNTNEIGQRLQKAFEKVPDSRLPRGKRHPLPAILALSVSAMLSGAKSQYAVAQWGRLQSAETIESLGFSRDKTPSVSTLHEVFTRLDVESFESALAEWIQIDMGIGKLGISIDGKGLNGIHGEELPGVRLVSAYAHEAGLTLAQIGDKL